MDWKIFVNWSFYDNTVAAWTIAAAVLVFTLAGLILLKRTAVGQLHAFARRTDAAFTDISAEALASTRLWFLLLVAIRAGTLALVLPARVVTMLQTTVVIGFLVQLAIWGNAALRKWLHRYSAGKLATDAAAVTTMRAVVFLVRLLVWALVFLVGLDNLGVNVTTLIAGLGVGGIAVALAAQNILGDLFASLSIVVDKPFVVGDFIAVDDFLGTVDQIGLKTTRLRGLGGEQLVFSNTDLLKSRIRNYRQMKERRILFSFGVEYETPLAALEKVPGMVREIIEERPLTRFDRAHLKSFGNARFEFEVVYYVLAPEYTTYMDIQQAINFELIHRFAPEGIGLAHPTQKLYLNPPPVAG